MTTKHTPGPWAYRYDPQANYARFETRGANPEHNDPVILAVREDWSGYLENSEQGRANARLIASAPALLEALRAAHHALYSLIAERPMFAGKRAGSTTLGNHLVEINRAIAAATGGDK